MREQYRAIKKDGTLTIGSLLLEASSQKEKKRVLKEYKSLAGAAKLVKVWDGEKECYEEVKI